MSENPGLENVETLLKEVDAGNYVIPYFQRDFGWAPSMVCDLIESILQNYYAGLILFWDLDRNEAQEEKWEPVYGSKLIEIPNRAVLDGQQRLSSLYYAIYNPTKVFPDRQSYYMFYVDLNMVLNKNYEDAATYKFFFSHQQWSSIRKSRAEWIKAGIVPLSILSAKDPENSNKKYIESKEFETLLTEFVQTNHHKLPSDITTHKVYMIFNNILAYSFVCFPLSDTRDIPDICNIFARVNAKGMKLSMFDLMNAFLYPKGIKLRKDLWENLNNVALKKVDSNMNEYLLKLISLFKQSYCSSKYIYNLIPGQKTARKDKQGKPYTDILVENSNEFKNLWHNACSYAEEARKMIMNTGKSDFGALKPDFIPNTTIIPVLAAILWEYKKDHDDVDFRNLINKWYWSAVFSLDYSGSSDTVMGKDCRNWKEWINTGKSIERTLEISKEYIDAIDFKKTTKNSARYNAIICMLAFNDAKDFFKGRIVGTGDYANENINDHHIFPRKVKKLKRETSTTFNEFKDSIVNRTLLLDETNRAILNKIPSVYTGDMISKWGDEQKVIEILRDHMINDKAYEYLRTDDFDNFIVEREKEIKHHIMNKLKLI